MKSSSNRPRWALKPLYFGIVAVLVLLSSAQLFAQASPPKAYMTQFVAYEGQVQPLLTEQMAKVVRERLEADPTVKLLPMMTAEDAAAGPSPAIVEATRLFGVGRAQYVDQRFDEAAESFASALDYFEKNVADIEDWARIESLLFHLSASYAHSGQAEEAKQVMRRLIAFNPQYAVGEEQQLPESYRGDFEALQKGIAKQKKGGLDLSGVEEGAEVWVDGSLKIVTPLAVEGLSQGTHFLVLRLDDREYGALVTVGAGESTPITAVLEADVGAGGAPEAQLAERLSKGQVNDELRLAWRDLVDRTAAGVIISPLVFVADNELVVQTFIYEAESTKLRALEVQRFDIDLLNINVNGYMLTQIIINALYDQGLGELVDGEKSYSPDLYQSAVVAVVAPEETKDPVKEPDSGDQQAVDHQGDPKGGQDQEVITISDQDDPNLYSTYVVDEDEDSWLTSPWLWSGVGVALVGAAVITAVVLTAEDETKVTGFNAKLNW